MPTAPVDPIALDSDIKRRLQRLAEARQRPADRLLHDAVEQYVEREERRDRFDKDSLAAWAEFQESGLHITRAEADAWLARLEAGEKVDPPAPHK